MVHPLSSVSCFYSDIPAGNISGIHHAVQEGIQRPFLHDQPAAATLSQHLDQLVAVDVFFLQHQQRKHFDRTFFEGAARHIPSPFLI